MRRIHRRDGLHGAVKPAYHRIGKRLRHDIAPAHHHQKQENLHCGRKNNVPHDRHQQAVLARQMAERHAHIDEQRHARNAEHRQHEQLQPEQQAAAPRHTLYHIDKQGAEGHIGKNADAEERRDAAQRDHNHRDDGLTEQVLRNRDRQGEHEVALTAEQVFVKTLDEDDSRYHKCRHHHAHIQHGADGRQHKAERAVLRDTVQQVRDERHENQHAVQRQTDTRTGFPLIFQQL